MVKLAPLSLTKANQLLENKYYTQQVRVTSVTSASTSRVSLRAAVKIGARNKDVVNTEGFGSLRIQSPVNSADIVIKLHNVV